MTYGHDLILVHWKDSRQPISHWQFLEDFEPSLVDCVSVGWLVFNDGADIALAPNMGPGPQACGIIQIPICAIVSLKVLS